MVVELIEKSTSMEIKRALLVWNYLKRFCAFVIPMLDGMKRKISISFGTTVYKNTQ